MARHAGRSELKRLDKDDPDTKADLNIAYRMIFAWAREADLNLDPPLPAQLRNRQADNWRPFIAIADASGAAWAARAREAAVVFAGEHQDEDATIVLLHDIREIFDRRGVDRLPSQTIVDQLNGADDAMWSEWRPHENHATLSVARVASRFWRTPMFTVVPTAISSRASSHKVNWRSCWSHFKYGRGPSGHYPAPPENRPRKDTAGRNLRQRGGRIAKTTSRRHNREISGTCGACKASHAAAPPRVRTVTAPADGSHRAHPTCQVLTPSRSGDNASPNLR
jgi:hypothetical protein